MEAKSLFLEYTHGTGNIDLMYGTLKVPSRQRIMAAIAGKATVTQKDAAWSKFREAIATLYNVTEWTCIADMDHQIREAAVSQ